MTCQSTDDSHISFAKRLAHNNKQIRDQTLKKLKRWLISTSKRGTLTEDSLIKIFKGLHYSMWYSDKPLLQENLAADIASILGSLPEKSHNVQYFVAFCETISREWTGIDRLRLDKFYMFFKTFLKRSLIFCQSCDWNDDVVAGIIGALDSKIFNINCTCPDSVAVFVAENFYTICGEIHGGVPAQVMFKLLVPFVSLLAVTPKRDITRILLTQIFNPLCETDSVISVDKDALSEYIFTLARGKSILTRNRKILYSLKIRLGSANIDKDCTGGGVGLSNNESINGGDGLSNKECSSNKRKREEMEKENYLSENISDVSDVIMQVNDGTNDDVDSGMKDNDDSGMKDNDDDGMKDNDDGMKDNDDGMKDNDDSGMKDNDDSGMKVNDDDGGMKDGGVKDDDGVKHDDDDDGVKENKAKEVKNDNEEIQVAETCKVKQASQCLGEKLVDREVSEYIDNVEESYTCETNIVTSNPLHVTPVISPSHSSDLIEDSIADLFAESNEVQKPKTKKKPKNKEKKVDNPEQDTIPQLNQPQNVAEETQTIPEIKCAPTQNITSDSVAPKKEPVLSNMEISVEESPKVSRRKTRTRRKKSVSVSESVRQPKSEVTPQPVKKKVRLSVENNTYSVFKKNSSLESPTPFDSTKTPVRSAIRRSSRTNLGQKNKICSESAPKKTSRRKSVRT